MLIYCEPAVRAGGPVNEPASHTPSSHRARAATAGAVLLLAIAVAVGWPPARSSGGQAPPRPNVIVVLTDDQSVAELTPETMPETIKAVADEGTGFSSSIVSSPLCCPSRAGFLSGQYPHNSGVFDNEPGYGALIEKDSILPAWLQAAGYRTGWSGRFLLNYDREPPPGALYDTDLGLAPPAGVEDWFGFVGSETKYRGATFSDNGTPVTAGTGPADYSTKLINRDALGFVRDAKADPRPFFLMVSHLAPHSSNTPVPGVGRCGKGGLPIPEDAAAYRPYRKAKLPKPPSFDESKISDKPEWVATRPALGHTRRRNLKLGLGCALSTLSTVDRGVGELVDQLERQGELDNTAIFFTSDNGYFFGEHRIFLNKVYPYEEALRVPLLARVPPAPARRARPPPGAAGGCRRPGQQPRPDRDHPRSRRGRAVHGLGRLPDARRPLAAPAAQRRAARLDTRARPALPARRQPGLRADSGGRAEQLLRRDPHQALRLRRARPRQQGDRRVRPAGVRALRPEAGSLPAPKPGGEPGAGGAVAAAGGARGAARRASRLQRDRRPRRRRRDPLRVAV